MLLETEVGTFETSDRGRFFFHHGLIYPSVTMRHSDEAEAIRCSGPNIAMLITNGEQYYYDQLGGLGFDGGEMSSSPFGHWKRFYGWEVQFVEMDDVRYKATLESSEEYLTTGLVKFNQHANRLRIEKCS